MKAGSERVVRPALAADARACAAIYAPYVLETAISFEAEPPSDAEMGRRIAASSASHAWLLAQEGPDVVGYAYAGRHQTRAAYRWSCETSVYVERGHRGEGLGRALYEALFARLGERGYRMAVAGMTLPNEASEGLHRALGFTPVGVYREIGFKLGRWHDVAWVQRPLGERRDPPAEPR